MAFEGKDLGWVNSDPKLKYVNGQAVLSFWIGFDKRKKQGDEWTTVSKTSHNASIWGGLGEYLYETVKLAKGDRLPVWGEITERTYTDKEGAEQTISELRVSLVGDVVRKGGRDAGTPYSGSGKPFASDTEAANPGNDW